ncbi:MAG: hypothetical protein FWG68_09190 [Defluviitaleaceae bacterium]|nr:hypothetical protein [Defluviitaleaceae bacterium]
MGKRATKWANGRPNGQTGGMIGDGRPTRLSDGQGTVAPTWRCCRGDRLGSPFFPYIFARLPIPIQSACRPTVLLLSLTSRNFTKTFR